MGNFHHVTAFADLGEHYLPGETMGEVYDNSVIHTSAGTHIVATGKGCICTFLQKDNTTTGNKAIKTKLLSSACCALKSGTKNENGAIEEKLYILGALESEVYLMAQDGDTISSPKKIPVQAPQDTVAIQKFIRLETKNGYKVLTVYKTNRNLWFLGYLEWADGAVITSMDTRISTTSPNVYWVKQDEEDYVLYEWEGKIYADSPCPSYDKVRSRTQILKQSDEASRIIGAWGNLVFYGDSKGVLNAYELNTSNTIETAPVWTVKTGDSGISEVRVVSAYDALHIFAYSGNTRKLYHSTNVPDCVSGEYICIPLACDVLDFSVDAGTDCIHLSIVKGETSAPQIVHYSMSNDELDWSENGVYLESENEVRKIQGHIMDITFCQKDNTPVPDQSVLLWTSEDTTLCVNGKILRVGPQTSYIVKSNAIGCLEIVQESDTLDCAVIIFREIGKDGQPVGNYYTVTPGEKYKVKLKGITKKDLDSAVTSTGEKLVDGDFEGHRSEMLEHTANAVNDILKGTTFSENEKLLHIKEAPSSSGTDGLRTTVYHDDPTPFFQQLSSRKTIKSCILNFDDGKLSYRQVTSHEAFCHIRNTCQSVYGPNTFMLQNENEFILANKNGFFSSIASFFKAVVKGIVSVAEIIVHAVESAVSATVRFIDNMVEQVICFSVKLVKTAVHIVESVLKQIKIGIEKVIQWVGFMFDWGDIQLTAKYIENLFEKGFDWMDGTLDTIQDYADRKLIGAEEKLKVYFDRFRKDLPSKNLKEDTDKASQDNPHNQANAHNIVQKHLTDENISIREASMKLSNEDQSALEDFSALAERISLGFEFDPTKMLDQIHTGSLSLNQIGNTLMDMLGTLLEHMVDLARKELHILIAAFRVLLKMVKKTLSYRVQIPLVTPIIEAVTGMDMTVLNLASFGIAIPFTIAYKLINHEAPIKQGNELTMESSDGIVTQIAGCFVTLIGAAQVGIATLMCIKKPAFTSYLSAVEIALLLGYGYEVLQSKQFTLDKPLCTLLLFTACLECLYDIIHVMGGFTTDRTYYITKTLTCIAGCIINLFYVLDDVEKNIFSIAIPGGLLHSVQGVISCCFYRTRSGENWPLVVFAAVVTVINIVIHWSGVLYDHYPTVILEQDYGFSE